jgi:hypothetical protein
MSDEINDGINENELAKIEPETLIENSRLFERVREILNGAQVRIARSVNTEMVRAYWFIGRSSRTNRKARSVPATANRSFNHWRRGSKPKD